MKSYTEYKTARKEKNALHSCQVIYNAAKFISR